MTEHARGALMTVVNTRWHQAGLVILMAIVIAHWGEHIAQAVQIYLLDWARPRAGGLLGLAFPWLVTSEWLHYGFALFMLAGLVVLRRGFVGRAASWWTAALVIQVWHHFEHLLLLVQAATGAYLFGSAVPTSVIQLVAPRVELHLFYNAVVFVPMVVATVLHRWPRPAERAAMRCGCGAVARSGQAGTSKRGGARGSVAGMRTRR